MMDERGKSDRPVLPMKSSNKAGPPVAERMEGRGLTKGNPQQQNASRTQSRRDAHSALERIRRAASKDKETWFTALFHHIDAPNPTGPQEHRIDSRFFRTVAFQPAVVGGSDTLIARDRGWSTL